MNFDPNPLFFEMAQLYQDNKGEERVTICNEGSSRSSKTWDTFHFIIAFCDHNRDQGNDIYILRDTLTNCRDYTFKEFKSCAEMIGIKLNTLSEHQKPKVNLWGNNIYFRGLEDEGNAEGYPSDVLFINEALETLKTKVDGLKMRCRKLMIMDWNPKYTTHWCFNLEGQSNVFFTHTTYKNNKHLQQSIIREIESYDPWEKGSYAVENGNVMYKGSEVTDKNQPPPHKINVAAGSADEFRHKVYALGLRGAMKGLVFPVVYYIDEFPALAFVYGNDFGFTVDPNATVKYAREGNNIYLELLCYSPIETPEEIAAYWEAIGIDKTLPITADSSDKYVSETKGSIEMVTGLRRLDWQVTKVRKTQSVMFWLLDMKTYKIHIIKNHLWHHVMTEQKEYRMKEINGIAINQPEDKYNHFWDAARYAHMSYQSFSIW